MEIAFNKRKGLAPAVIQDATTAELLMVGFMNREALEATLRTGFVTFYSRTRPELWTKGEASGNVCHTGSRSCFTEELPMGAAPQTAGRSLKLEEEAQR